MQRSQCALIGAILSFVVGWPTLGRSDEAKPTPFIVGQSAPSNTFLAIWMAQAEAFYRGQGLAVEVLPMTGGSESGPALSSGRIQIMHIASRLALSCRMQVVSEPNFRKLKKNADVDQRASLGRQVLKNFIDALV